MPFINHILPLKARFSYTQDLLTDWVLQDFDPNEKRKFGWILRHAGIASRHSMLPDFTLENGAARLYQSQENPTIQQRMTLFSHLSAELIQEGKEAFADLTRIRFDAFTHLITVSCTGLSAPGLDFQMQQLLGLKANIARMGINFMGCHAGLHALKLANWICGAEAAAKVLIIDIELCSLHFQRGKELDDVLANGLFADGAAMVMVSNTEKGIRMEKFFQQVSPNSAQEMAWKLSGTAFEMRLSSYVAEILGAEIRHFIDANISKPIKNYAVHPGGLKILKAFEMALELPEKALAHSLEVLHNYGNTSSASIFYVLHAMLQTESGSLFAAAFGPGLTLEGGDFEIG